MGDMLVKAGDPYMAQDLRHREALAELCAKALSAGIGGS